MKYAIALFIFLVCLPFQAFASESAATVETKYVEVDGVELGYRDFGSGDPIVMFNRLRGTIDTWDPAFLDALAKDHRVIIVDYPGVGYSDGTLTPDMIAVADTMADFTKALDLKTFDLVSWSWGGALAQVFLVKHPERVDRAVLMGTNPPGQVEHGMREDWFKLAVKPVNDLKDEETLFFDPAFEESLAAAKVSHDRIYARPGVTEHIPSTMEEFKVFFVAAQKYHEDKEGVREALTKSTVPMLVLGGANDPSASVDNWFPLLRKIPRAQLVILPRTGHGPQHQYPDLAAAYIRSFLMQPL